LTESLTLQIYGDGGLRWFDLSACTWLHQLRINYGMFELPSSIALLTDLMQLHLSLNRFTSIDAIDFVRMSKLTSLNVSIGCGDGLF
jgi:Leucine-rich repeat (LRR) protein